MGGAKPCETIPVCRRRGTPGAQGQVMEPLHATDSSNGVLPLLIEVGEFPQHRGLAGRVAELNEMFSGIVETAFRLYRTSAVEKHFSHLAVSPRQAFFIAHQAMGIQGLGEQPHGFIPLLLPGFFQREIVVENAQRAMVIEWFQQVQRFEIVGTGFLRFIRADVEIAQIYESVGNGMRVALVALDGEHFFVTGISFLEGAGECQGVTQIAETIGEFPWRSRKAIILHRGLPGGPGLDEIPSMKKNARAMLIVFSHTSEPALVCRTGTSAMTRVRCHGLH